MNVIANDKTNLSYGEDCEKIGKLRGLMSVPGDAQIVRPQCKGNVE